MTDGIITQEDAVNELYKRGRVCITACKEADIDTKYRSYLALFADGTFLVDERARSDITLQNLFIEFCKQYPSKNRMSKQYVSAQILEAIYRRAQDFDWYQPQYDIPTNLTVADRQKLHCFLERVLRHQCLSITTLTTPNWFQFYSPDKEKFALFNDGWLVVAQNSPHIDMLTGNISRLYPQIEMVEVVPWYYVEAVYEKLLYTQPSAREIYINLLIQKYMKRLKITSEEALKVMQNQIYGWRNLLLMSEQKARSMIYSEYIENCLIESDEHFATQMATKKEFRIWGY